ncbi:hypothetical protein DUB99_13715 [Salmonella enterica subsp. enterica serovar Bonariensis]|nr:hypothetical protein [Salmonella enterica subsp. enterica serovar Bonariensis]EAO5616526.1 hypothetical protein [Salmonella enterica]EDT7938424.1 hypothetical protein [Salmonella enterica subsp. enterica serovar Aba]EBE1258894.1 hypothetical protein [Salmonella enterica]EBE4735649.1 hypothetical protein [Salmonella enterica]
MSEQQSLPLDFPIPSLPIKDLSEVANHARWILKRNQRSNSQIQHVQKLIMDMIDIFWQEEREKEIQQLEMEARERLRNHYWGEEEPDPDLYPFALRHNRYGEYLEFVGDESDLNLPGEGSIDDVEVLNEIIDWFVDNEESEGFIEARPAEYFSALALLLVAESVYFIHSKEVKAGTLMTMSDMTYIAQPAMKAMKAVGYARQAEMKVTLERDLHAFEDKIDALKNENAVLADASDAYKVSTQKANDARHVRSREAKQMVWVDWLENRRNFKSLMDATRYYKSWLEAQGIYFEPTTINRWLILCAKNHPIQ